MQLILTQPVRKLGKVGEIVNVKNGFGRNYLLPNEMAIRASKDNIAMFDEKKKEIAAKNAETKKDAEAAAKKITGKNVIFITQAAADGRLFGSVSSKVIAAKLSEESGFALNYSNILLDNPVKFTGMYSVEIAFHPEIHVNVMIVVARSDSEAQDIIVEGVEGKNKKVEEKSDAQIAAEAAAAAAEAQFAAEEAAAAGSEEATDENAETTEKASSEEKKAE